jgi:hypothetical protein
MPTLNDIQRWLNRNWTKIIGWLMAPGVLFVFYAYPWIAGIIITVCAGILLTVNLRKNFIVLPPGGPFNWREVVSRWTILWASLLILGLLCIGFNSALQSLLLDTIYKTSLLPREQFREKIEAYRKQFATNDVWHIDLKQSEQDLRIPSQSYQERKNQDPLSELPLATSSTDRLFFLLGDAGTGKTPLLEQWAFHLLEEKKFSYILYVSLRSNEEQIKEPFSLHDLCAKTHKEIVDSADYYRLLFQKKSCLVILDDFDELITDASKENVLRAAQNLVLSSRSRVIIGSRPEGLFLTAYYGRELQFAPYVSLLWIQPVKNKDARKLLISNAIRRFNVSADVENDLSAKLSNENTNNVLAEMMQQLDYINYIVKEYGSLKNSSDYQLVERLVVQRTNRNRATH